MNLNVMLLVFVLGGFVTFSGILNSEIATENGQTSGSTGSLINDMSNLLATPHVNVTQIYKCTGFVSCTEGFYHAAIDVITSIVFIIYDIVILFGILIVIFVFPFSSSAPIYLNLIVWTLEIGGMYVLVGMFRGGE